MSKFLKILVLAICFTQLMQIQAAGKHKGKKKSEARMSFAERERMRQQEEYEYQQAQQLEKQRKERKAEKRAKRAAKAKRPTGFLLEWESEDDSDSSDSDYDGNGDSIENVQRDQPVLIEWEALYPHPLLMLNSFESRVEYIQDLLQRKLYELSKGCSTLQDAWYNLREFIQDLYTGVFTPELLDYLGEDFKTFSEKEQKELLYEALFRLKAAHEIK